MRRLAYPTYAIVCVALLLGCRGNEDDGKFSQEEAMDPANCEKCHPDHYREWLGSMHAYAAEDPVFLAMNELGQRETDGELGDFCISCHAPVAVALGLTEDGTNLDEVPAAFKGVTCYACHNVEDVDGIHNNPLKLAMDTVMRGGIREPDTQLAPHGGEWSKWLAGGERETRFTSTQMCGACHDIVTPAGVHLERTYLEWQESLFADTTPDGVLPEIYSGGCVDCHMGPPTQGPAADVEGVRGDRILHPHDFPGVDVHITDFPDAELGPEIRAEQLEAIETGVRKSALCSTMCVTPGDAGGFDVRVWLHNEAAGHSWPSGASQDRRAWLELIGYEGETQVYGSGVVDDVAPVAELEDPELWLIREQMFDAEGEEVHMFWEAHSVQGNQLTVSDELTPAGDAATWQFRDFHIEAATVDRVTSKVRLRPIGHEVLRELIDEGVLDPQFAAGQTFDMPSSRLEWTPEAGTLFCDNESTDCGDFGSCIAPMAGDAIALSCTPLELQAAGG